MKEDKKIKLNYSRYRMFIPLKMMRLLRKEIQRLLLAEELDIIIKIFQKKINKKYLTNLFKDSLPSEDFAIKIFNREGLNSKIKNEIVGCEIDIEKFSAKVLDYKQQTKPPGSFKKFSQISDLPFSSRDLSFSIKDFSSRQDLEKYVLGY